MYLIKNATIVNDGKVEEGSILIEGGRIKQIIPHGGVLPTAEKIIDAEGYLCLPGVIDDQVHFRDPGLTHKGDLCTESEAALLGGVTSFMDMPNTKPQTTTLGAWQDKMAMAEEKARANYAFYFGATNDNAHLLKDLNLEYVPGVKVFMGASTGNMLVDSEEALERIFKGSPKIVAVHSESEPIIQANIKYYREQYGEELDVSLHPYIRSREACLASSIKAVQLAKKHGTRLHILHLSTADELSLFHSDSELNFDEKLITAEVCVHHLWFTEEDYPRLGTRIKWNPAVKGIDDREALRRAVKEQRVDVIATDHAPHLLAEKEGGALTAASGGPLVQHSLIMMLELVQEAVFDYPTVVEYMCHRPARLFGVQERGYIREGYKADLVLVQPRAEYTVTTDNIKSKCGWSPLEGYTFHHRVWYTFLNGVPVVEKGMLNSALAQRSKEALKFSR